MFTSKIMKKSERLFVVHSFILSILFFAPVKSEIPEFLSSNSLAVTVAMNPKSEAEDDFAKGVLESNHRNDLRRLAGSPFLAKGTPLIIEGYVTDIKNVPLDGTKISILQTNNYGAYNHLVTGTAMYDKDFSSYGDTITDNTGHYIFYTIFPGTYDKRAPHINFLIENEDYKTSIQTELFFAGNQRNYTDAKYKSLNAEQKKTITAKTYYIDPHNVSRGKIAKFDIILNVMQDVKSF